MLLLVVSEAMAIAAVSAVLSWLVTNWWVLVVLGACAAVGGAWWFHRFQQQQAWERVQQQPCATRCRSWMPCITRTSSTPSVT
ncbi:hypothetical protein [Streptomyces sp. NPDC050263]|uniref:hypothetical protein n=1 Tax=Streptomyces sp. NPDC050263 TaxID=3155037 RepID=UPI003418DAE7